MCTPCWRGNLPQQVCRFRWRVPPLDAERGLYARAGIRLRGIPLWGGLFWHWRRRRQQQLHRGRRREAVSEEARGRPRRRRRAQLCVSQTGSLTTAFGGSCTDLGTEGIPRTKHNGTTRHFLKERFSLVHPDSSGTFYRAMRRFRRHPWPNF